MDMNFTGQFWGMPFNFTGQVAANHTTVIPGTISITSPNTAVVAPWQITLLAALSGAIVGGFITFAITYAKTKAEMKWKLKLEAYKIFIDGVDQAVTGDPSTNKTKARRAKQYLEISCGNPDVIKIAKEIIDQKGSISLADLQNKIDNEFIPKAKADLKDTIDNWWKFWK